MSISTLTAGTLTVPYMPMTVPILDCPPPVLEADFSACNIPGDIVLWPSNGFYSPGVCFQGYEAACTQTSVKDDAWPIGADETVVRCIPTGYECNEKKGNPMFATSQYDGTTLSAPAFEIRWRSEDLQTGEGDMAWPTMTAKATTTPSTPSIMSTTASSSASQASTTATSSADSTVSPEPSPSPLDASSIAGIAVGALMATFLIAMAITAILHRHRRHKAARLAALNASNAYRPEPSWAVSPNQPPVELHPESVPRELESEPASPGSAGVSPVSPTSTVGGIDRTMRSMNRVPIEMEGDGHWVRDTGVERGEGSGTAVAGSKEE